MREPHLLLCHISHLYETGASLYFTVAAKAQAAVDHLNGYSTACTADDEVAA